MDTIQCRKCGCIKPQDEFIKAKGLPSTLCKVCNRAATKQRYKNMMSSPERKEDRLDKKRGYGKKWYHTRKEDPEFRKMRADWHKNERKTNPIYNMKYRIRVRTRAFLATKGLKKDFKTQEMLGCDWITLYKHLESQFKDGMSWENRNLWEIDHIIELQTANTLEEIYKLGHYTNLQPLWQADNVRKGGITRRNMKK